jgi:hypothetical protein
VRYRTLPRNPDSRRFRFQAGPALTFRQMDVRTRGFRYGSAPRRAEVPNRLEGPVDIRSSVPSDRREGPRNARYSDDRIRRSGNATGRGAMRFVRSCGDAGAAVPRVSRRRYLAAVGRWRLMPGRGGAALWALPVAPLVLSACGASTPSVKGGSAASFAIAGVKVSVTVGNGYSVSETFKGSPELNYAGPEGCKGQAFTAAVGPADIDLLFRYSSSDAYMVDGDNVYHFVVGPLSRRGELVWDQTFGTTRVVASVACPPPPPSGPLLPPSY